MAKFTTWNITKHINTMTLAWAIWILSIFLVDFIDMYFLSILWESELAAAVWFAGVLIFLLTSIWIALMITMSSIISKVIWKKDESRAKIYAMNIYYFTFFLSIPLTLLAYYFVPDILSLMGASWQTLEYAISYFRIVVLVYPFLLLWMCMAWVLRWVWDAKMSMMPTLIAWGVNIILDPIFIFWFGWWIEWAAIATSASRIALLAVWTYWVWKHSFFTFCNCFGLKNDLKEILSIFLPALATNIATPIGNSFILKLIAEYWDDAVAWMAVIGRLIPVIFVYIFALSGSIWSIVWQNYGAWLYDRVRESIIKAMTIAWIYVLWMTILLVLFNSYLIVLFNLSGEGAMLLWFYSNFLAIFFVFNAMIFVWNATFNVIWKAYISMIMNFLRSIIFLIPLIFFFSWTLWVKLVLIWEALSISLTGMIILFILYRLIWNLKQKI